MLKTKVELSPHQPPGQVHHPSTMNARLNIEKKGFKRAEAAIYLGVAKITIDRLTRRGLLHPSRALRHPIYSKDDLDRFLRETSNQSDSK